MQLGHCAQASPCHILIRLASACYPFLTGASPCWSRSGEQVGGPEYRESRVVGPLSFSRLQLSSRSRGSMLEPRLSGDPGLLGVSLASSAGSVNACGCICTCRACRDKSETLHACSKLRSSSSILLDSHVLVIPANATVSWTLRRAAEVVGACNARYINGAWDSLSC